MDPGKPSPSRLQRWLIIAGLIVAAFVIVDELVLDGRPEYYENPAMHFKYGSIGSDNLRRGLPYRIWEILPEMFPDHLPTGKPHTYEAFGLTVDRKDSVGRPIGFSKRWRLGVGDFVGINCAFCHTSTIRTSSGSAPTIVLGMPANTVDAEAFFHFLFTVVDDDKFNAEALLAHMKQKQWMGYWQTFIHRYLLIPAFKDGVKDMKHRFQFLHRRPTPFGPGRVDTWAFYKVAYLQDRNWLLEKIPEIGYPSLHSDPGSITGLSDFPSLWKEKPEKGAHHWDGNTRDILSRNITAAMGAGVTPATADIKAIERIATWLESEQYPVPKYQELMRAMRPDYVHSQDLLTKGRRLFDSLCFQCHSEKGAQITQIVPVEEIGTDPAREKSFTEELARKLNDVRHLSAWQLIGYGRTKGYANLLLTGIWLRAPYLHNGSVPTLWDLLQEPDKRTALFCRGNNLYDWTNVGFEWRIKADARDMDERCSGYHLYDTKLPGNRNTGHTYGTTLSEQDKWALIEYMKTL